MASASKAFPAIKEDSKASLFAFISGDLASSGPGENG
jgi:hypothetical protein